MAKMATKICTEIDEVRAFLGFPVELAKVIHLKMREIDDWRRATPSEAAKANPMGASNECMTCGGDVRGCMC